MTSILLALAVLAPIAAADRVETPITTIENTSSVSKEAPVTNSILLNNIERSFKVKYGDKLVLDVGGGPVEINTSKNKKVEILIKSRGGEIGESDFEIKQEKGVVYVIMKDWDSRDRRWNARISYTIRVPQEFDLDVSASGGRTEIGDIKGEVFVHNSGGRLALGEVDGNLEADNSGGSLTAGNITGNGDLESSGGRLRFGDVGGSINARGSGGSLRMGNAGGPADLHTSGGGIEAGDIEGSVEAEASGGSIEILNVKGDANLETSGGSIRTLNVKGDADLKTSGGGIRAGAVTGEATAKTSGGSIRINEVGGTFNASTSGGHIEAYITKQPQGSSSLRTSGGGVVLYVKDSIKFSLQMDVDPPDFVSTNFATKSPIADDATSFDGDINGGGPRIKIWTSGNRYNEANIFVLKASSK